MSGQTCPRCSVSTISPRTGKCELCGFAPGSGVAVVAEDVSTAAARELGHEIEIGALLGKGAGSAVFRAFEKNTARNAILKVVARRPDVPDAEESFRAMLGMFATFDHPHLIPVLRYGSTDSLFWYTTEDVGGNTLRHLLQERGALDARTCRRIATQVVGALDYLHRHGVVHGAVKIDNIILDKDGWVRVCDPSFVRARWKRRSRSTPTRGITSVGGGEKSPRPTWVAPEDHERGERLPAADQYALGALIYECATGEPPADPPEPVLDLAEGLPPQMARAIETAMAVEPFRRFGSMAELLFALEARNSSINTPVVPSPSVAPSAPRADRATREIVMVQDWEPPAEAKGKLGLVLRVAAVVAVVVAAAILVPGVLKRDPPSAPPVVSVGAPSTIPSAARTDDPVATAAAPPVRPPVNPPRTTPRTPPAAQQSGGTPTSTPSTTPTGAPATTPTRAPAAAAPAASVSPTAAATATGEPGRLFINSSPWGSVSLDGVTIGNTPRANVEVSAGTHTLRITRPGFETIERTIRVAPGEVVRITDIVLVPARP